MNSTTIKFLINIKNVSLGPNKTLILQYDYFSLCILKVLYNSGLIQSYSVLNTVGKSKVKISLRRVFNKTLTKNLKPISTPTYKLSLDYKDIIALRKTTNSTMFFSTDQGLLTASECKKYKIGGVLLFIC